MRNAITSLRRRCAALRADLFGDLYTDEAYAAAPPAVWPAADKRYEG